MMKLFKYNGALPFACVLVFVVALAAAWLSESFVLSDADKVRPLTDGQKYTIERRLKSGRTST